MVLGILSGSMKSVDWPASPLDASMNVMPASSKILLSSSGFFRYSSMASPYGSMPCRPKAEILFTAHKMSCWPRQMELVVPKRMSGLTGSSGRCEAAAHALDDPATLAAAAIAENPRARDRNARLLSPRSVIFKDIDPPSNAYRGYRNRNGIPLASCFGHHTIDRQFAQAAHSALFTRRPQTFCW